jgi:molybdopterin-guanine dinucleotide biosynthesis protein A
VSSFGGAVLCGGASRRMGRDKALVERNGRALAARVADALHEAGAVDVVFIGGNETSLRRLGHAVVPDGWPGEGPLGGVITALDALDALSLVAVLACDLLEPDPAAIAAVVSAAARRGVDVAVPRVDGRLHYHHAVWRREVRPSLLTSFDAGERAMHRAAALLRVAAVEGIAAEAVRDADEPGHLTDGAI